MHRGNTWCELSESVTVLFFLLSKLHMSILWNAFMLHFSITVSQLIVQSVTSLKYLICIWTVWLIIWNVLELVCLALQPDMFTTAKKKKNHRIYFVKELCCRGLWKNSISHNLAIGFRCSLYYTLYFYSSLFYIEITSDIKH